MTCWLCHGGATRRRACTWACRARSSTTACCSRPPPCSTTANADAAAYRRARGFPPGRTVRARLLLAGPGAAGSDRRVRPGRDRARLPLGALRGDRARAPGDARHRQPDQRPRDPGGARAGARELVRLRGRGGALAGTAGRAGRAPGTGRDSRRSACPDGDRGAARRALLFDLRNLGTLGLQQDSFPGLLWSDAIYGHAQLSAAATRGDPSMYAAASVREAVAIETAAGWSRRGDAQRRRRRADAVARGPRDLRRADRGNDRQPPDLQARAARLRRGEDRRAGAGADRCRRSRWTRSCRCAAPTATRRRRWRTCGRWRRTRRRSGAARTATSRTSTVDEWGPSPDPLPARERARLIAIASLASKFGAGPAAEVAFCAGCHAKHRDFGPVVCSSSRLFPFDADGDGDAQGNPGRRPARRRHRHRAAARVRRPDHAAAVLVDVAVIPDPARPGPSAAPASAPAGCAPRRSSRCARARPTCTTARSRRCARCSNPPRAARSVPARRRRLRARHARPRQRQPGPRVRRRAQRRREAGPDRVPGNALGVGGRGRGSRARR